MRVSDMFPSRYMRAEDYPDNWSIVLKIQLIRQEEVGEDREKKPVMYFHGIKSGLVLNKTMATSLVSICDSFDSDDWPDHEAEIFRDWTSFGAKTVKCLRLRKPSGAARPAATKKSKKGKPPFNDSIDL